MEVMIKTCCGIDVHQKSIVCCILDGPLDTNKPKKIQKKFGTPQLFTPPVTIVFLSISKVFIIQGGVTAN